MSTKFTTLSHWNLENLEERISSPIVVSNFKLPRTRQNIGYLKGTNLLVRIFYSDDKAMAVAKPITPRTPKSSPSLCKETQSYAILLRGDLFPAWVLKIFSMCFGKHFQTGGTDWTSTLFYCFCQAEIELSQRITVKTSSNLRRISRISNAIWKD